MFLRTPPSALSKFRSSFAMWDSEIKNNQDFQKFFLKPSLTKEFKDSSDCEDLNALSSPMPRGGPQVPQKVALRRSGLKAPVSSKLSLVQSDHYTNFWSCDEQSQSSTSTLFSLGPRLTSDQLFSSSVQTDDQPSTDQSAPSHSNNGQKYREPSQPQSSPNTDKSCHHCSHNFGFFLRKRQCQKCQLMFCSKCIQSTGLLSLKPRLCLGCAEDSANPLTLAEHKPSGNMCCATRDTAESGYLQIRDISPLPCAAGEESEAGEPLDISILDTPGPPVPWAYNGPIPQSIFQVRDRECAMTLSVSDSEPCQYFKTVLVPSQGCECRSQITCQRHIQRAEFEGKESSWCKKIRLDMDFSGTSDSTYVHVRVETNDTQFDGVVLVDVQRIKKNLKFVDDLTVTCYNINNPSDTNDSITISGSFAWKLFESSFAEGKMDMLTFPISSPRLSHEDSPPKRRYSNCSNVWKRRRTS